MSTTTKIEWCDHTWSPWRGCTKVSPGCANCYAERLSKRNPAVLGKWGKGKPRVLAKNWGDPVRWNREASRKSCGYCSFEEAEGELIKQCCRCAVRPRVFPSLCDPFDDEVPIEFSARFLNIIHDTPNLDWLLLTKRPENWGHRTAYATAYNLAARLPSGKWGKAWMDGISPSNVLVGSSVEDQPDADRRIPDLLKIPAKFRFLSVEPMLGPVDLRLDQIEVEASFRHGDDCKGFCDFACGGEEVKGGIDWVIVGGESGRGARPCGVDWIRDIVSQCAAAGVACFVNQLGSNPTFAAPFFHADWDQHHISEGAWISKMTHPKGGDPDEWPEDLRVRQFPEVKP